MFQILQLCIFSCLSVGFQTKQIFLQYIHSYCLLQSQDISVSSLKQTPQYLLFIMQPSPYFLEQSKQARMFILCSSLFQLADGFLFPYQQLNAFLGECIPSQILSAGASLIRFKFIFSSGFFLPKSYGRNLSVDFTRFSVLYYQFLNVGIWVSLYYLLKYAQTDKVLGISQFFRNGWANIYLVVNRFFGSRIRIFLIKSFPYQGAFVVFVIKDYTGKVYSQVLIFLQVSLTQLVSNGGLPNKKAKQITPIDHISTQYEWPTDPQTISGAIQFGVPHMVLFFSQLNQSLAASPKSPTLISILALRKIFPNLRSRWITLLLCIQSTAEISCNIKYLVYLAVNLLRFFTISLKV